MNVVEIGGRHLVGLDALLGRELLPHQVLHQLDDRAVLHQPLGVGAAAGLEAHGLRGHGDLGLHIVVGALGPVGDHQLHPVASEVSIARMVSESVPIWLALISTVLIRFISMHFSMVASLVVTRSSPMMKILSPSLARASLPALVVVLGEAVLDGHDRHALRHGLLVERQDLVAVHHDFLIGVAPELVHADFPLLPGLGRLAVLVRCCRRPGAAEAAGSRAMATWTPGV